MKPRHLALWMSVAVFAAGCGGKKRPPAIATAGMATPAPQPTAEPTPEPVAAGPDVRPLSDDRARSEEFATSDATGEGGPLEDVRFGYNQAVLDDPARALLERHAAWLKARPAASVRVEGHCDERGTVEYNLALGEQRARVARDYLVSLGVGVERLSVVSFGKERPLDPGHDEAAWARNRRAHFLISKSGG